MKQICSYRIPNFDSFEDTRHTPLNTQMKLVVFLQLNMTRNAYIQMRMPIMTIGPQH
jgi:hypothetical protein